MKHLFITDLDGTLLNDQSQVSDRSAAIISQLSQQGALITIATARTPATVEPLLRHTFTTPPAIVMTGAAIWHRTSNSFGSTHILPHNLASTLIQSCALYGLNPFIYTIGHDNRIHVYHHHTPNRCEQQFVDQRSNLPLKQFHLDWQPADYSSPYLPENILLVLAIGPIDTIEQTAAHIRAATECSVSAYPDIFNPHAGYLELFAIGVSKANAIEHLRHISGADHLTVFGDNLNDLPMFAIADTAVAVANALPQVKEAADVVIGPNTSDSVAEYIAHTLSTGIKSQF